jgi:plastocyanin
MMTRRTFTKGRLIGGFAFFLAFAACGGGDTVAAPVTPTATATVQANPAQQFSPGQVDITTGGTVTWQFSGLAHNVTFTGSAAGTPANIGTSTNVAVARTFSTAGSFTYVCTLHPGMQGTVVVH